MGVVLWFCFALGCVKGLPPTLSPAHEVMARTDDGWSLAVRHYPGDGPPVLLVHGMGANHYNWDYREEVSLAWALQQRGFDVWVPNLRGDPGSRSLDADAVRDIRFADHARHDLPAIVDRVLAETGETSLLWVGHSMGGMLLYTALAERPETVRAGVAVASPALFTHLTGRHRRVRRVARLLRRQGRWRVAGPARRTAGLGRMNPLFGQLAVRGNLDWPVAVGLAQHALIDFPRPMAQEVSTWLRAGALLTPEGEPWLVPTETPLLVFGSSRDHIVPERDVADTCAAFPQCTYVLLGPEGGFDRDYGHVDPVLGVTASTVVYPRIIDFLEAESGWHAPEVDPR